MSQYLQLRAWARESSGAEKGVLATTMLVVLGLVGWALVPTGSSGGAGTLTQPPGLVAPGSGTPAAGLPATSAAAAPSSAAVGGSLAGSTGSPAAATGTTPASGNIGAPAPTGPTRTAAGATSASNGLGATTPRASARASTGSSCGQLAATDTGVTPTQIRIAAVTLNLGGAIGNSAVGVSSAQQQQQMAQAMVDEINANGGVACRKLSVTFYSGNPIDPSTVQQACLNVANGGFFAAIDMGGFSNPPGSGDCVAQHKVPLLYSNELSPGEIKQYYPYLMTLSGNAVVTQRTAILGMDQRGWFSPADGFKKLGLLMDDCSPEVNQATLDTLASIGIAKGQISIAEFACPSGGFASPSDMEAAVIQHVRDGVTNVIPITGGGSFKEYSSAAQRQGFKPKYTTTDYDGFEITATGGTGPDVDNFDGTVSVSNMKIGANTSGMAPDAPTQHCIDIFKKHGLSPDLVYPSSPSQYPLGGGFCSEFLNFAAAAEKDPGLTRAGLLTGLDKLGRAPMAYPFGDAVFDRPGKATGGDFWWVVQFSKACTCWKVIDPTFRPSYT